MLVAGLAKCSSLKRANRIGSAMCAPILFVPQQQTLEMVAKSLLPKRARKRTGGIQMTTTATYETLSASEHSAQLRKAVIASTIGTAIEWYDFFLYGTAAGLIFGKLFFPNSDPLTATLAAFGTYFIGFVGRPIGAAIFGHYGDRIGRKATLIATLLCMGIATFLIAFVPTYETVGIWGAVILTVLRMIQGIGVGGEWGGSVLLAMEWSRHHGQRGLVASWPHGTPNCGQDATRPRWPR